MARFFRMLSTIKDFSTPPSKMSTNQVDPTVNYAGNIILRYLNKLEPNFPALRHVKAAVIRAEASSPQERVVSLVGLSFLAAILRKNHVFGTQFMVVFGSIWSTAQALQRSGTNDYEKWLFYWSVFGVSTFSDWIIKNKIYHYCKVLFFYWLSKDGSLYIYHKLLTLVKSLKE